MVEIPARTVESLIALSIAYVAIENMLGKGYSRRWLVGFGFGLVHGLGFYTVLSQLNLERSNAALTLLSFNLGVEAGQIVILALLFPVLVWGSKRVWYSQAQKWVSASILIMAAYWFFQRAFLA